MLFSISFRIICTASLFVFEFWYNIKIIFDSSLIAIHGFFFDIFWCWWWWWCKHKELDKTSWENVFFIISTETSIFFNFISIKPCLHFLLSLLSRTFYLFMTFYFNIKVHFFIETKRTELFWLVNESQKWNILTTH